MKQIKNIKEFEGLYYIDITGNVYSVKNNIILKPSLKNGYLGVTLSKSGKKYSKSIHRLIAESFIPNPENKSQINHKNGIKTNNKIDNLEWVTASENSQHAYDNKLRKCHYTNLGKHGGNSHNSKAVIVINKITGNTKKFDSCIEASKYTKLFRSIISKICNGKQSHDVFELKFTES